MAVPRIPGIPGRDGPPRPPAAPAAPQGLLSLRRAAWGGMALLAAIILGGPALRDPPQFSSQQEGSSYPGIVRRLAAQGLIKPELIQLERNGDPAPREHIVFDWQRLDALFAGVGKPGDRLGHCPGRPFIDLPLLRALGRHAPRAADCKALFESYARKSFLQDDMRFTGREVWRQEDGRLVGIAATAHIVPDAFGASRAWRGRVDYARPWQPLYLVEVRSRLPVMQFTAGAGAAPPALDVLGRITRREGPLMAQAALLGSNPGQCPGVARVGLFGDMALLTMIPANSTARCPRLWRGNALLQDRAGSQGAQRYYLLQPGETITLGGGQSPPVVLQLVRGVGALSAMDGDERRADPSLADIGNAIAAAQPRAPNVRTSIEPRFQIISQRLLDSQALGELQGEVDSFRAAALLVDGLTGEVLAAPTFPTLRSHLTRRDQRNQHRLGWLENNQNLAALPVGSMAKVPVATAIVQAWPQLLSLHVGGRSPRFSSVIGIPFSAPGKGMEDHSGRGADVNFTEFIAQSSNHYAFTLMALAASEDPLGRSRHSAGADAYMLGGQRHAFRPVMPSGGRAYGRGWVDELWRIDCIVPYAVSSDKTDPQKGWSDQEPEAGCPRAYLGETRVSEPGGLGTMAHSPPDFGLRNVRKGGFYQDYLMSIVGQSRSTWSNAALVQAYARIISNRKFALRFDAQSNLQRARWQGFPDLNLHQEVWQNVTAGLSGTVDHGTAKALKEARSPAFAGVELYAKTGTSSSWRDPRIAGTREWGHGVVVAFVRYRGGQRDWRAICSMRLVVANFEDRDRTPKPGVDYVQGLMRDPMIAAWLAAPCPAAVAAETAR